MLNEKVWLEPRISVGIKYHLFLLIVNLPSKMINVQSLVILPENLSNVWQRIDSVHFQVFQVRNSNRNHANTIKNIRIKKHEFVPKMTNLRWIMLPGFNDIFRKTQTLGHFLIWNIRHNRLFIARISDIYRSTIHNLRQQMNNTKHYYYVKHLKDNDLKYEFDSNQSADLKTE